MWCDVMWPYQNGYGSPQAVKTKVFHALFKCGQEPFVSYVMTYNGKMKVLCVLAALRPAQLTLRLMMIIGEICSTNGGNGTCNEVVQENSEMKCPLKD